MDSRGELADGRHRLDWFGKTPRLQVGRLLQQRRNHVRQSVQLLEIPASTSLRIPSGTRSLWKGRSLEQLAHGRVPSKRVVRSRLVVPRREHEAPGKELPEHLPGTADLTGQKSARVLQNFLELAGAPGAAARLAIPPAALALVSAATRVGSAPPAETAAASRASSLSTWAISARTAVWRSGARASADPVAPNHFHSVDPSTNQSVGSSD
jgi:hypothetical protein